MGKFLSVTCHNFAPFQISNIILTSGPDFGEHYTTTENEWQKLGNNFSLKNRRQNPKEHFDTLTDFLDFNQNSLRYLLATGTRCTNLATYLEGCEYSGAEHLKHPFLMHLYAQQIVIDFISTGVLYAELRASPKGYTFGDLTYRDACQEFKEALGKAQDIAFKCYQNKNEEELGKKNWYGQILGEQWHYDNLKSLFCSDNDGEKISRRRFPVKINLIFVGKRHKSLFEMIQEAASVVTYRRSLPDSPLSAKDYVEKRFKKCDVVGFDLAGDEPDNPPNDFQAEFERLSRMHIPVTIHAGENAPSQFIADAVLSLGAKRIGHGLSISEDTELMNRLRDQNVCIELCPVSNYQTSIFSKTSRKYPLKLLLDNGNPVCINTDNPVISNTNMVKECFHASFAYGGNGLSLWELLRIIRQGFLHSFLSLPEKRAIIELADQILFDLLYDPNTVELLKCLRKSNKFPV